MGVRLGCGCEICGYIMFVEFFFFLVVAVADIGGWFLIYRSGWWLWAVVVDLQVWDVVDDGDDREEIIYYFNV